MLVSSQLSIEIFDKGTPSRAGLQPATVSITIYKNRAPGFTTTQGRVITVNEDVTTGNIIDTLNYQDPDASVSKHSHLILFLMVNSTLW
ncbi:hypothetical protein DPMN_025785 [Dreissena polymorpha]|uniref:Uncharacterized protein n=1 Tax=Dreissena polymorpha TaxID=45954 RepID=A0A9D4LRC7_DREPO|nr:hypothetical protein DPMN_025785 [Dreissena polymorpha]